VIRYFEEDISFKFRGKRKSRAWINDTIAREGFRAGVINFIFCSDSYLHDMNIKHLGHDSFTDIITFDLSERPEEITGDIFISIDRARENAGSYGSSMQNEVRRLLVHGILHLCGYGDKSDAEKQAMRQKEDYYLSLHP
jgi:rRNA maturation RNase YbeY